MQRLVTITLALLFTLVAGQAGAKTLSWHGTMDVKIGALQSLRFGGSGVSTVNNSSGGNHLNTLRIAGGITGSGTVPITDPDTTTQIPSFRFDATLGTGTLSGISGAPPLNPPASVPIRGFAKVCILTGCDTSGFLPVDLTTNSGATGVGIGGLLTVGDFGNIRISLQAGPWTIAATGGINQTVHGGFTTISKTGFAHGAASNNSSTATESGVIQLISPQQVITSGIPANSSMLTLFGTLTLHFIPEPGLLLLLGSGIVGLGLLGRKRMKG